VGRLHDSTTVDAVRSWANRHWKLEEKEQARQASRARQVRDALEKWHQWRERAETEDERLALGVSLHRLPGRLRFVVEQRFLTQPPLTLQQVGDRLGVTKERARAETLGTFRNPESRQRLPQRLPMDAAQKKGSFKDPAGGILE
jgi:DNA-directed RNA polymerase sigma subunit (sigma70/sigma32)